MAEGRQNGDDRTQEQVHQEDAQGGHVQVNSFSSFPSLSSLYVQGLVYLFSRAEMYFQSVHSKFSRQES